MVFELRSTVGVEPQSLHFFPKCRTRNAKGFGSFCKLPIMQCEGAFDLPSLGFVACLCQ